MQQAAEVKQEQQPNERSTVELQLLAQLWTDRLALVNAQASLLNYQRAECARELQAAQAALAEREARDKAAQKTASVTPLPTGGAD
jgi:hypothetical protein